MIGSLLFHTVVQEPAKTKKKGKEKQSLLDVVNFKDSTVLPSGRFEFRISAIQQEALSRATGHLPHPSKQLELAVTKKKKKPRSYHVCI